VIIPLAGRTVRRGPPKWLMRPEGGDHRFAWSHPFGSPALMRAFAFGFSGAGDGALGFTPLGAWKLAKPARGLDVGMVLDTDEGQLGH
jgi:hypothetical protein